VKTKINISIFNSRYLNCLFIMTLFVTIIFIERGFENLSTKISIVIFHFKKQGLVLFAE
jgi:uncharacterized membrane protein YoaT (DUF817 family)